MEFVSTELLKPNMKLSEDIYLKVTDTFDVPLMRKGTILNSIYINKIKYHRIPGVYIESDSVEKNSPTKEELVEKQITYIHESINEHFNNEKNNRGEVNVELSLKLEILIKNLIKEVLNDKKVLLNLADLRLYDKYTFRHSLCVAILSITAGYSMHLNKVKLKELAVCALLHDVGKMAVPIGIIDKPDLLTSEEYSIVKNHPVAGVKILKECSHFSKDILDGIESHHEKFNGTGYPYGKSGTDIPLYARILAIADVYDALTSTRSYRRACFPSEAIEYIMGCSNIHFDHDVLINFLANITAFKVGTIVSLSNNKIAVVLKGNKENVLRPVVKILNNDETASQPIDLSRNTNYMNVTITGMGYENQNFPYNSKDMINCKIN